MTADEPIVIEGGVIQLSSNRNLYYDGNVLEVSIEKIKIEDAKISQNWGREAVYRISLSTDKLQKNRFEFTIK
jgi:hypothetical protein